MKTTKKKGMMFTIVMAVLLTCMTAHAAEISGMKGQKSEVTGQLVSLNSGLRTITIEAEVQGLSGPEKKVTDFQVSDDAKWHICLAGECTEATGEDGFRTVSDYLDKETSGTTLKNSRVTLYQRGNIVIALNVDIPAPDIYKK